MFHGYMTTYFMVTCPKNGCYNNIIGTIRVNNRKVRFFFNLLPRLQENAI